MSIFSPLKMVVYGWVNLKQKPRFGLGLFTVVCLGLVPLLYSLSEWLQILFCTLCMIPPDTFNIYLPGNSTVWVGYRSEEHKITEHCYGDQYCIFISITVIIIGISFDTYFRIFQKEKKCISVQLFHGIWELMYSSCQKVKFFFSKA